MDDLRLVDLCPNKDEHVLHHRLKTFEYSTNIDFFLERDAECATNSSVALKDALNQGTLTTLAASLAWSCSVGWTMLRCVTAALLLLAAGFLTCESGSEEQFEPETPDWRKTLKTIRNGIHKIDTYLNYALDLIGGSDGLCKFKCSDGYKPSPRPSYKPSPPNGCGSPLFGFHFDIGIPSMTKCCNQHDRCYDTCGKEKHDCDGKFQVCLETICRNVQTTLGLDQSVQACESAVTLLFDAVMHLGCKPYLDSQRASCICRYEEKIDL